MEKGTKARPSSANPHRTKRVGGVSTSVSSRPHSAVASKKKKPDMQLVFAKSEPLKSVKSEPIMRPKAQDRNNPRASDPRQNSKGKGRNLGTLGFYLDQENFNAEKEKADKLKKKKDGPSPDRPARPSIRRSFTHNATDYSPNKADDRSNDGGGVGDLLDSPLSYGGSHVCNPQFLRAMRDVSYAFPSHGLENDEDEGAEEIKSARSHQQTTQFLSNRDWRTVKSSTVYPYHRSIQILTEVPVDFYDGMDDIVVVNPDAPVNVIAKRRYDYVDEIEEYAQEDTESKKSFRDRFRSVVGSIHRESSRPQMPTVKCETGATLEMGMKALRLAQSVREVDRRESGYYSEEDAKEGAAEGSSSIAADKDDDDSSHVEMPPVMTLTPREAIIRESISRNQIPFVLRELLGLEEVDDVTTIDLSGKGIGDEKMCCLVRSLPYFRNVEEILVGENRLTDASIQPFLRTVFSELKCLVLDVSANKLDSKSIDMLKAYLKTPECTLKELRLRKSDVDDMECADMVASFILNQSLTSVNLSDNLIGEKEDLNHVQPDFETGGEAIADMLLHNRCLTELDISWNSIRGESAVTLGQSVSQNNTLRILNLAYNNIGDEGAQHLAHSLRFNVSLESIDVSYNNLTPRTALVYSQVLCENHAVIRLNFNGNCAGKTGSKALLRAIRVAAIGGRQLKIDMDKANILFVDDTFDRTNPSGDYTLDASNTYGYTVACILCEIANEKPDAEFTKLRMGFKNKKKAPAGNRKPIPAYIWKDISLTRGPSAAEAQKSMWTSLLTDMGIEPLESSGTPRSSYNPSCGESKEKAAMRKLCFNFEMYPEDDLLDDLCEHIRNLPMDEKNEAHLVLKQIFIRVFEKVWYDTSAPKKAKRPLIRRCRSIVSRTYSFTDDDNLMGVEDISRVLKLLVWQNIEKDRYYDELAFKIIKTADVFSLEKISRADFVRYMFLHYTDMYATAPGPLIDDKTGCPWVVPTTGMLDISFMCTCMPPSADALVTEDGVKTMIRSMRPTSVALPSPKPGMKRGMHSHGTTQHTTAAESQHGRQMLKNTVMDEDFFVDCDQAEALLAEFLKYEQTPVSHLIEMLLPQVATNRDACRFLASNLTYDQLVAIRDRMGSPFRVITGVSGGHYSLDLSKKLDRMAARKLSEHCNLERAKRLGHKYSYLNTSQTGDNDCFRNASYNAKPIILTSAWFDEIPENGKLRFDYVNTDRPVDGLEPVSAHTFNRILNSFLFTSEGGLSEENSSSSSSDDDSGSEGEEAKPKSKPIKTARSAVQKRNEMSQFLQALKQSTGSRLIEKQIREQASAMWQSTIQSSWTKFYENHVKYLLEKLKESKRNILAKKGKDMLKGEDELAELPTAQKRSAGATAANKIMEEVSRAQAAAKALQSNNEAKNLHNLALYSLIYREARLRPVHLAEVFFSMTLANKPKPLLPSRSARKRSTLRRSSNLLADSRVVAQLDWCMMFESVLKSLEILLVYQVYFSVEQVEQIVKKLIKRGAPAVVVSRCLQILFPRIVDLENMPLLVNKLPSEMKEEIFHRIGVLNVWNPIHMDGEYKFDLASWDQREALKMAIKLSTKELNESLSSEKFFQSAAEDEVPGWMLPRKWTTDVALACGSEAIFLKGYKSPLLGMSEAGGNGGELPKHGTVTFSFTSDPTKINLQERIELAAQRTLALYRGKFIDSFSRQERRKPRIVHQSAVKFVGSKLRRLTNTVRKNVAVARGFGVSFGAPLDAGEVRGDEADGDGVNNLEHPKKTTAVKDDNEREETQNILDDI